MAFHERQIKMSLHGKIANYCVRKCRCSLCVLAWREYCANARKQRLERGICVDCTGKAEPNRIRCRIHLIKASERMSLYRERKRLKIAA